MHALLTQHDMCLYGLIYQIKPGLAANLKLLKNCCIGCRGTCMGNFCLLVLSLIPIYDYHHQSLLEWNYGRWKHLMHILFIEDAHKVPVGGLRFRLSLPDIGTILHNLFFLCIVTNVDFIFIKVIFVHHMLISIYLSLV